MTSRGKVTWPVRVVAGVLAAFWALPWFGLIDLLVVVDQDEGFHEHYLMESGWGLLFLVLVTTPLVVLCFRPGRRDAVDQLWVCAAAVVAGAVWGWAWPQLLNGLALAGAAWLLDLLAGRPVGTRRSWQRPDPLGLLLGAGGLVAAVAYGHPLARNVTLTEDITNGVSHFPMQASLGLAVAGLAVLAAFTGSRLAAWTTAFAAAWIGIESVAYPDLVGSLGVLGGWAAVAWAVLVVLLAERHRRALRRDH
jgi:hypothetical protein